MSKEKSSLSRQVMLSSAWTTLTQVLVRLSSWVYVVVMARLLGPEDFGLMGLVTLTTSTLDALTLLGLETSIIQMKEGTETGYLDAAWTANVIRSFALSLVVFAVAPWVAAFYKSTLLTGLLRLVALAVFIRGFVNIGRTYFFRDMTFNKLFLEQLVKSGVNILILIPLALVLRNVWALAIGHVIGKITAVVLSYVLHPYRPRLEFDFNKVKRLFRFGKWMLGMQTLKVLSDLGDNALVGKVMGVTSLGYYSAAYRFGNEPAEYVRKITSEVMFPAYAKIRDDQERLRRGYLGVLELIVFAGLPLVCGVFFIGQMFVVVVL
jgi:lipopolysaccharide exporter